MKTFQNVDSTNGRDGGTFTGALLLLAAALAAAGVGLNVRKGAFAK